MCFDQNQCECGSGAICGVTNTGVIRPIPYRIRREGEEEGGAGVVVVERYRLKCWKAFDLHRKVLEDGANTTQPAIHHDSVTSYSIYY